MFVSVSYCDDPNSALAGQTAAQRALSKSNRDTPCNLALLFCTARHNQLVLRQAVSAVIGDTCPIYGGGAVGIITNHDFGYAGDQVGIALIWTEDSHCTVITEEGLEKGERETGIRLGKRLAQAGTTPTTSAMLFYDAVDYSKGDLRLMMATWLLEGIQKGLGFLPDLVGAGLQGDHSCSATQQYLGEAMGEHSVISLAFSDDISIDSVIMHGCHPASPYYTVTKADGPVILEINETPALQFMDELLDHSIAEEDYPFFLIFGINHGDRWGEYNEDDYASRLCLGIDKKRNGIIMFEPDMVKGTEFQLMFRSLSLDYMAPKIEEVFARVKGREPIFAMYIDCAGRCAGYGGVDIEDALVVQKAVGDKIPLLGIYTGVEIASIGERPRGLDWTGVFCIFSKQKPGEKAGHTQAAAPQWHAGHNAQDKEIPINAIVKLCQQNAAKVLTLDKQSIAIRYELEQKRRGFSLLAELSVYIKQDAVDESIFLPVTQRINTALNMQRTVVLFPTSSGLYVPRVLQGYPDNEKSALLGRPISIDKAMLNPEAPILVTGADDETQMADLRNNLKLRYFVSTPIIVKNEVAAILITGRMVESAPYLSRLGREDVETLQAISALLASVLVYRKLDDANRRAQTDGLTGLLNRGALELLVTEQLQRGLDKGGTFAFIIIDFDYFKQVNDTYGHMEGDAALRALASALQNGFRSTDFAARVGGDEFALFCPLGNDAEDISNRVVGLLQDWSNTPLLTGDGRAFKSTLSIGMSVAPRDGTTYSQLFRKADIALYQAKQSGRNRYIQYSPDIHRKA